MEQQSLIKYNHFNILFILTLLLITTSCIGIRMDSDINLGDGYYYVQDYPQCICRYPKPGKVVLPIGDKKEIVVRVQYNDSIIIAVCSSFYYSLDSTIYQIEKKTGEISSIKNVISNSKKNDYKEILNHRRYKNKKTAK
ncbi:MAG: hypothetical protein IKS33_01310 [Bacteroidales bacterium]|nr:hypothetical protein [Bacteroidales bacterium]